MKASKFRNRIKFRRRTQTNDGYGNKVGAWSDVTGLTKVPARIAPVRGDESVIQERLKGTGIVEITVRQSFATLAITTDDMIEDVLSGQTYNIRHISNKDERDRNLTMLCEYGVADG